MIGGPARHAPPDRALGGVPVHEPGYLPIGQLLLRDRSISPEDLDQALNFQSRYGGRLGEALIRLGSLSEDRLLAALGQQLGMGMFDVTAAAASPQGLIQAVERSGLELEWWVDQQALPWIDDEGGLHCPARDPLLPSLRECVLSAFPGMSVIWWLIAGQDLDRLAELARHAGRRTAGTDHDDPALLRELAEEAPVIELVNNLLSQASAEGASDIHVEPEERQFRVRFRIDGVLQTRLALPRDRFDAVASRIKLVAGLDIAERRLPQDGRLTMRLAGETLDIRVSSLPSTWGESLVLRLLPKERQEFKLDRLGMQADHLARYREWIGRPHGIFLVTGPTGSGKSTTLYATLEAVNDGTGKIVTVEEPVEYNIPGVNQVQAHAGIGYTFARALRAILRQDPDKIMIGEIRDLETAEIAVQAALTGHMVFSTLHTNDALSAFTRLVDMGVEPFLVCSSVQAVVAQRLVRRLCPHCSQTDRPPDAIVAAVAPQALAVQGLPDKPLWRRATGCPHCRGIGYSGRLGIYEMVGVTQEIRDAVLRRAPTHELEALARIGGHRTLREDGLLKAWKGLTSVEEVLRVTGGDVDPA